MCRYEALAAEPGNLSKVLSSFSQVVEGLGSSLAAGLGATCIVHIIAGILCFLGNSQQEIPGTNLSTFLNKIFRGKKKKGSETKCYRTKTPILTSNHRYVVFWASFVTLFFPLKDL